MFELTYQVGIINKPFKSKRRGGENQIKKEEIERRKERMMNARRGDCVKIINLGLMDGRKETWQKKC